MRDLKGATSARFDLGARLPGQVFLSPEELGYQLTDSAVLTEPEFWSILGMLCGQFDDRYVFGRVLDDLRAQAGLGQLPFLELSPDASREDFQTWVRARDPARTEPLYIDGRTIVFCGDTGRWGIWIDQDRELAVLGIPATSLGATREGLAALSDWPWYEAAEIRELLSASFYPDPVPEDVVREIRRAFAVARV